MEEVVFEPLIRIRDRLKRKEISSTELCQAFLNQCQRFNDKINAVVTYNEKLLEEAGEWDRRGDFSLPLSGIPVGYKDMFCTRGLRTSAASKALLNFVPPYSATVVQKMEEAGALLLGKLNQDEFAMGSSNEASIFGPCRNPWSLDHVPGGSSGGSAAATSAGMVPASFGTDTGGSVRQPAHFCGLVGVKPTYGRVSRYGIVAFASSLDQAGIFTRTVEDAALLLETVSGRDPRDMTTSSRPPPRLAALNRPARFRVGMLVDEDLRPDSDTEKTLENCASALRSVGGEIVPLKIDLLKLSVPIYYLIATSEASSNLARYDGIRFGHRANFSERAAENINEFYRRTRGEAFGEEVKRRIILGTYCLSSGYYDAYYKKACSVRRLLRDEVHGIFSKLDLLMMPVAETPAFRVGEKISDPIAMYKNDIYTTLANLCGLPALSLPAGFSREGLPIGVQLLAAHFEEEKLLSLAQTLEASLGPRHRRPSVLQ